jgi:transposase InsO family protein
MCLDPREARLKKQIDIRSIIIKKLNVVMKYSDHKHPISENKLNRDFSASSPGKKWISDIAYDRTRQVWLYLTIIMNLFDRK